jgi:hypothetical protein
MALLVLRLDGEARDDGRDVGAGAAGVAVKVLNMTFRGPELLRVEKTEAKKSVGHFLYEESRKI